MRQAYDYWQDQPGSLGEERALKARPKPRHSTHDATRASVTRENPLPKTRTTTDCELANGVPSKWKTTEMRRRDRQAPEEAHRRRRTLTADHNRLALCFKRSPAWPQNKRSLKRITRSAPEAHRKQEVAKRQSPCSPEIGRSKAMTGSQRSQNR